MNVYFTDFFGVSEQVLEEYGAFNVSLLVDLPLFVDPFLLFNSDKPEYRDLHQGILRYLRFLRDHSAAGEVSRGLMQAWYCFKEVRQNWLGFSADSNSGHGLGLDFAYALKAGLANLFPLDGVKPVTKDSHLEKLCLIKSGVGRDTISDFTTNLIKEYLLEYTERFAAQHIDPGLRHRCAVEKVKFNYETRSWQSRIFDLPWDGDSYVILTPRDMLSQDDTWINKEGLYREYEDIPYSMGDTVLRAQIEDYFRSVLPEDPDRKDWRHAVNQTASQFPILLDLYIKLKEDTGDQATENSADKVAASKLLYVQQFSSLIEQLSGTTPFYQQRPATREDARLRILYLKDVIENKGGWRIFYVDEKPLRRESDLQILYRLVWFATSNDVSREVNDGRGPVDFKVSHGADDKTLVEMKLAGNTSLRKNLENQAEIYQRASDAKHAYKVIIYFTFAELSKVHGVLDDIGLRKDFIIHESVILIDARSDNKPSASKATSPSEE